MTATHTAPAQRSTGDTSTGRTLQREQQVLLAIDAGGTATRALIVDYSGHCLGLGQSGGGNPTSVGLQTALSSITTATATARQTSKTNTLFSRAVVAMAGASRPFVEDRVRRTLISLGLAGEFTIESDLLAMYYSGTTRPDGHVLLAGTGAGSAHVQGGKLHAVAGGLGWLIGDGGSGYWIGHHVAMTVAAALDGVAAPTALTGPLLQTMGLTASADRRAGRPAALVELIDRSYNARPIQLAQLAPLAFQAQHDPTARAILAEASAWLARTVNAVRATDSTNPVVLGGSVLAALLKTDTDLVQPLTSAIAPAQKVQVPDGVLGAAVLALSQVGRPVDDETLHRMRDELAVLRISAGSGMKSCAQW